MQQRQPRLGDILDDYCPRERRITNHVVVAMIGDEIKQTRCSTCEAEHEYKQARVPPQRKKKEAAGGLFQDVLNSGAPRRPVPAAAPAPAPAPPDPAPMREEPIAMAAAPAAGSSSGTNGATNEATNDAPPPPEEHDGPVHRQLIRATLPRHEGQQKDQRPIPEFTIRAATKPGGRFRHGRRGGGGIPGGNSDIGNSFNFRGRRGNSMAATGQAPHGNRARPAHGERHGQSRRRGGKKRSK
jgi:hypothetical protein